MNQFVRGEFRLDDALGDLENAYEYIQHVLEDKVSAKQVDTLKMAQNNIQAVIDEILESFGDPREGDEE